MKWPLRLASRRPLSALTGLEIERVVKDRMEVIAPLVRGHRTLDLGVVDSRRNRQGTTERLERKAGLLFRQISEVNPDVVGVDIDDEGIAILWQQGFHARTADVMTMDLKETFEVIVAGEIIEHLTDPGQFLRNMRRHLATDGTLVITTPNPFSFSQFRHIWRRRRPRVHEEHVCWFDPIVLSELCRRTGLEPYLAYWVTSAGKTPLKTWPRRLRKYFSDSFILLARPAKVP
jgi:SAM-dependent methyltransferase